MLSSTALTRTTARLAWRTIPRRTFIAPTLICRQDGDLPYHIVVGMPALSPTMESGALAEWYLGAGDAFAAGDAVAKIETDKASMDFEAQDDGFVAKLLRKPGNDDILVGTPILITVEDADDVAAFADYVPPVVEAAAAPVAAAPAPPPPPPPAPAAEPVAPPPTPAPVVEAAPPTPPSAPPAFTSAPAGLPPSSSPLTKTLSKQQTSYVELYGTTGQLPL